LLNLDGFKSNFENHQSPIKEDFKNLYKIIKKMSQDLTIILAKNTFVIENLFETIELINGHLDRAKPLFIQPIKTQTELMMDLQLKLPNTKTNLFFKRNSRNSPDG
jgi:hypothetical protein